MDEATKTKLIESARNVRASAYAPYSNYKVGAALLAKSGRIYVGCNFENAAFGAGVCAERVALGAAIAAGERAFDAIVCIGADAEITPCGICRQALAEFGEMTVICGDVDGKLSEYTLSELLPYGFKLEK